MPNKHDKSKIQTGFWTDKELLKSVKRVLSKKGITLTDEILKLMNEIAKEDLENEKKSTDK